MINIAIAGAAGRMGRNLVQACHSMSHTRLAVALEHHSNSFVGYDAGELAGIENLGITINSDLASLTQTFDVLIDFTVPESTLAHLEICRTHKKRMVIGSKFVAPIKKEW